MEFCMQTLSRISPNRDLAVDKLYNSMSNYRNLAVMQLLSYSGGNHVQSLHPSAALGPHDLPCSHMFFVHINTCSVRPWQANNTNNI